MESWPLETRLSGRRYFMNRLCLLSRQSYFLPLVEDLLRIKSRQGTPYPSGGAQPLRQEQLPEKKHPSVVNCAFGLWLVPPFTLFV